ncbi:MAG TPA: hypothetical protein VKU77_32720 [Streptosporangiaceae bacterium]|nr:hypothetical protein [Streptosporangiaceae bacterium]
MHRPVTRGGSPGRGGTVGQRRGHEGGQRRLGQARGQARGQQPGVEVRQPVPQQFPAAGHDRVRLHDLRRGRAEGGGRRRLQVRGGVKPVLLDHDHLVGRPGQKQRGDQPRRARSDDGNLHGGASFRVIL